VTRVKICGITRLKDALDAVEHGADALGFVFVPESPRFISADRAQAIIRKLPPFVSVVGVFMDAPVEKVLSHVQRCGLTAVQLHGAESPEDCRRLPVRVIKAFRVKGARLPARISRYAVDAILLDTYSFGVPGGTGRIFPWDVAVRAKKYGRIVLAGGLNGQNVLEAIRIVQPYAVDVSSGIEQSPGKKDARLLKEFIHKVKSRGT